MGGVGVFTKNVERELYIKISKKIYNNICMIIHDLEENLKMQI